MKKKNTSTRRLGFQLIAVILIGLIALATYFIVSEYKKTIKLTEQDTMRRLETVAKTLALHLDGNQHNYLVNEFTKKDELKKTDDHPVYMYMHDYMRKVQLANGIETDIYTLFIDTVHQMDDRTPFYFGITSGETPYYRHPYLNYPEELAENFNVGGPIPVFEDDHGTWLSYFAPISNDKGEVIAVVQVDQNFDKFLASSREEAIGDVAISLFIFLTIGGVLLLIVRNIIKIDELKSQRLQSMHEKVKSQHKDITDSINYSERIQRAIVPNINKIKKTFPESLMYYKAKDIISGDFPWIYSQKNGDCYIAAVDCTGHGVPGCMLSFVGYFLLNDIIGNNNSIPPGNVLSRLNNGVRETLQQDKERAPMDGMDIALLKINPERTKLHFSGAHRPLYMIRNGELIVHKGDRQAIGGLTHRKSGGDFTNTEVDIQKGDAFFIFSDGLQDQFGGPGEKKKKYSSKRIREMLLKNYNLPMEELANVIENDFVEWMGDTNQVDDVLLIGLKFE